MDVLVSLAAQVALGVIRGLWSVVGNVLCLGVACVLIWLYGVGSGWPLTAVVPVVLAGVIAVGVSLRGGLQLWKEGRSRVTGSAALRTATAKAPRTE